MARLRPLALLVLLLGCKEQSPTEIVVELRTDIPVPAEMNALRLRVSTADHPDFFNQVYDLGEPPKLALPAQIALAPRSGTPVVTVQAEGLLGGQVVVTRRATLPFVSQQSLLLQLDLSYACVATRFRGCESGSTCVAGNCAPEQIDPSRLPRFVPGQPGPPPPDAAPAEDASVAPDAAADAQPATDRPADSPALAPDAATPDMPVTPPDTAAPPDAPLPPDMAPLVDAPALPPDAASKKPNGDPCGTGSECLSAFCVDGYCCNTDCQGLCRACNVAGRLGSCTMFDSGQDPTNECGDDGAANCKRDGFCDGMGACRLYAAGTQCLAQSCAGATLTLASTCDGAGRCISSGTQSCSPYLCGPSGSCKTACTSPTDCLPPFACLAGFCVSPSENCSNGVDDDGDGRIDCLDPDCTAGFTCTPAAPPGWTGPVALAEGQGGGSLACAAPYATPSYAGKAGLSCPAASCSSCGCGSPEKVSCQLPGMVWYGGPPCVSFGTPGHTNYTCDATNLAFDATLVEVSPSIPVDGSGFCTPSGGTATLTTPTWGTSGLACRPGPLGQGGCSNAELCAPRPPSSFGQRLCIHAPGDLPCPAGYTGRRSVFFGSFSDSRGCTACTCDRPGGVSCGGTISFFPDPGCTQLTESANVPASCFLVQKGNVATIFNPSFSGGSCQRNGGAPSGACQPQMPATVCCQ